MDERLNLPNGLLAALSADDFALIEPSLERVVLPFRYKIDVAYHPIEFCHFITQGVAAVLTPVGKRNRLETGMIGCEGVTGIGAILGNPMCPNETIVQIPGSALRIAVSVLQQMMVKSPSLAFTLTRYAHVFLIQAMQTALSNGKAKIEMRLARWILMASDRVGSATFPITHELLALMLGVRRAGVTMALHILEGQGLIQSHRSELVILDRQKLEEFASWSYGVPEAHYQQVFGPPPDPRPGPG